MFKYFLKPDVIIASFKTLSFVALNWEVKLVLVDCDNTLLNKATHVFNEDGKAWIKAMQSQGIKVVLMSNNKHPLFETLAQHVNCPLIQMAMKPVSLHYRALERRYGLSQKDIVVIGDQLLTDIAGAKLHGYRSVYHKPLSEKDVGYNKPIRTIEKKWIQDYESTM